METMMIRITKELIFWLAWIIIPVLWEVMPAFFGFFILIVKSFFKNKRHPPIKYPEITIIVPVYNSQKTLAVCFDSLYECDYPHDMMNIIAVDNGSLDNSYSIFKQYQEKFSDLSMWWLTSRQGKSKALNMALFNSKGKYIIHIDSDGKIEKSALKNLVAKFEQNPSIHCMTGSILIDPELIENTDDFFMRMTRRCEMYEYCQAFLAGRNYEAEFKSIYTLSGAFSAFRKSAILKSLLYNSITVCEDTQITFQIRNILNLEIHICENALFFVDPIEDYNKLYTQRQRWQRGEIEVSHMFLKKKLKPITGFFTNFMVRVLMYDHTFAFPRAIWYFAIVYLFFINYPIKLIIGSVFFLYFLYVIADFLFYFSVRIYLKDFIDIRKYYTSKWYICFILPVFNFVIFWIRFAGIINCIVTDMKWKTRTLSEEWEVFKDTIKMDFANAYKYLNIIRRKINNE